MVKAVVECLGGPLGLRLVADTCLRPVELLQSREESFLDAALVEQGVEVARLLEVRPVAGSTHRGEN